MIRPIAEQLVLWVDWAVLIYFVLLNSFYALLLIYSIPEIWEQTRLAEDDDFLRLMTSDVLPPVAILVPAHNENVSIVASVTALLKLRYRTYEVIVVNDGSTDQTLDLLRDAFDLYEVPPAMPIVIKTARVRGYYRSRRSARLLVIDKDNGGKADALNAAINAARWPYVIAVDADTLIEPDALLRMMRPFMLGGRVAAAGGTVRVANECLVEDCRVTEPRVPRRFLAGVQVVEYLRAFLFGRLGWNRLGGSVIISGAFGMFSRRHLLEIKGYQTTSVVEDLDLVIRLRRHLRRQKSSDYMPFIPDPVAWTEVPVTTTVLSRQRERWHRGLISSMWQHKDLMFRPRFGRLGMVAMPFFCFGEMLAPVVEVFGYCITAAGVAWGLIDWPFAQLFFLVAWGYGMMLSLWAVALEEISFRRYRRFGDLFRLLVWASLENFGYRQWTVLWRLRAFWSVFRGRRTWGRMVRQGFAAQT
jgi:cellulose synthase/poly-beta-1,6-N-acetylglucosamine synthase-like glycosyltransferase